VSRRLHWTVLGLALALGVSIGALIAIAGSSSTEATPIAVTESFTNPNLDPGIALNAIAPGFTLTDQFGKRVSLRSLRGKVVVVSFNDPECTTICPLTTTALLRAKKLLGPAASGVELLGIGANPEATDVKSVRAYSEAHEMLHKWRFLTGSLPELRRVWRAYGIEAAVINGMIDHTPATYIVGPDGRESRLYQTAMAYSSVNQLGYEMARSIAGLLPGHPTVPEEALAPPALYGPHRPVTLPRVGGGSVRLGSGSGTHLVLFFDTWETQITNLRAQLAALDRYQAVAEKNGLPPLVAIDEAGVEAPSALVPGRPRPDGRGRRRLPRRELALARARLGSGPHPVPRGSSRERLADPEAAARAHPRRADEVKIFLQPAPTCRNLSSFIPIGGDVVRCGVLNSEPRRKRAAALCDGRAHRREFTSFLAADPPPHIVARHCPCPRAGARAPAAGERDTGCEAPAARGERQAVAATPAASATALRKDAVR
jgi:cytochrome oxidase Cu insertion factor (SCO1/SenC/PrrC family)